jgi:hypothetical protein
MLNSFSQFHRCSYFERLGNVYKREVDNERNISTQWTDMEGK